MIEKIILPIIVIGGIILALLAFLPWPIAVIAIILWLVLTSGNNSPRNDDAPFD